MPVGDLKPHPLNLKVYGQYEDVSDLLESVRQHGILRPLIVTPDHLVISSKRRLAADRSLGLSHVPVVLPPVTDPLEIELFLLEDNRTREKTNEQKA